MVGKTMLLTNPKGKGKGKVQEEEKPKRRRRRVPRPKVDVRAVGGAAAGGAGYAVVSDRVVGMLTQRGVPEHVARGAVGILIGVLGGKSKKKEIQAAALGAVGAAFADVVRGMQGPSLKKTSGVSGLREEFLPDYLPEDITVENLIEQ